MYRIGSRVVKVPAWSNVGGHFEKDELNDAKACMLREVNEEIGITEDDLENIKLKYIALRLKNNEVRQNYFFFADLKNKDFVPKECNEGILEWVDIKEVLNREMPFTVKKVMEHYLTVGKDDEKIYAGVATDEDIKFLDMNEF